MGNSEKIISKVQLYEFPRLVGVWKGLLLHSYKALGNFSGVAEQVSDGPPGFLDFFPRQTVIPTFYL